MSNMEFENYLSNKGIHLIRANVEEIVDWPQSLIIDKYQSG